MTPPSTEAAGAVATTTAATATPAATAALPPTAGASTAAAAPPAPEQRQPDSYEAALEELEALVARLDAGQMPLEQLLTGYQRGAFLLAYCRERLAAVEQQIQLLDDGQLKPWNAA